MLIHEGANVVTDIFIHITLMSFGVFFLFTGVTSFSNPETFAQRLSLQAVGRSGAVEIRAQYGGFFTAAALSQAAPFVWIDARIRSLYHGAGHFRRPVRGPHGRIVF